MVNSCVHVGTVSYLTTLFLGKSPGGSLPVLSAHSFASNLQLAFLNQGNREIFSMQECAGSKGPSRDRYRAQSFVFKF